MLKLYTKVNILLSISLVLFLDKREISRKKLALI